MLSSPNSPASPREFEPLPTGASEKSSLRVGRRFEGFAQRVLPRLAAYPWPGNVRELENILERAVILSTGPLLDVDPEVLEVPSPEAQGTVDGSLEEIEKSHILHVLGKTRWVIEGPQGAAAILGLHPNTLRSRLKKLGLSRPAHERIVVPTRFRGGIAIRGRAKSPRPIA